MVLNPHYPLSICYSRTWISQKQETHQRCPLLAVRYFIVYFELFLDTIVQRPRQFIDRETEGQILHGCGIVYEYRWQNHSIHGWWRSKSGSLLDQRYEGFLNYRIHTSHTKIGIHQLATRSLEDALQSFEGVLAERPTNVVALLGKVCECSSAQRYLHLYQWN